MRAVQHSLVNASEQNFPLWQAVGKEETAHTHITNQTKITQNCGNCICDHPTDIRNMDCIKVVSPEDPLGTPTTERPRVKEDQWDASGSTRGNYLLLNLVSLSMSLSPTPHFLLNKICIIEFDIWPHLHLDLGKGISQ